MMARPNIDDDVMERLGEVVNSSYDIDPSMLTTQQQVEVLLDLVDDMDGGGGTSSRTSKPTSSTTSFNEDASF